MAHLRQACDRCHDKKLRCPKQPGNRACTRCFKAGVQCAFSPPTKPSAPTIISHQDVLSDHGQGTAGVLMTHNDWTDLMDFAQTELSYDCAPPQDLFNIRGSASGPVLSETDTGTNSQPPSAPLENGSADPSKDATSQLSSMITSLDNISQKLSSVSIHHVSKCDIQQWADHFHKTMHLSNSLELLLSHSQSLAALYTTVSAITPSSADQVCHVDDCIHELNPHRPGTRLPFPLLNLLLTCHLQLLHALEIIVGHSRTCRLVVTSLPEGEEPLFDIPEVRIGSFVAPPETAASLFTTMLHQLLRDLQSKCKRFAAELSTMSEPGGSSKEIRVLCLQSDIINDRTAGMLDELQLIKTEMIKRGH